MSGKQRPFGLGLNVMMLNLHMMKDAIMGLKALKYSADGVDQIPLRLYDTDAILVFDETYDIGWVLANLANFGITNLCCALLYRRYVGISNMCFKQNPLSSDIWIFWMSINANYVRRQ